jgi:hypothetical protein
MTTYDSKLIISPEIAEKCEKFAIASAPTNMSALSRRGQTNPEAIKRQIKTGKIAEVLVHLEVSKNFPKMSEPDFGVYTKKEKSWDPDLKDTESGIRLAVKSQEVEQALQYYESWVFQFNAGKNYDCDKEIFGKDIDPNQYVSFVLLNAPKKTGQIRAIVKVQWLHDKKLFQPMALKKFSETNNKLAVYYDHPEFKSLSQFKDELWQL